MIINARQIEPFIHFGFNRLTFLQKQVGTKIRVFIDGNFNKNIYTINFVASGSTVTMITDRIYDVEYSTQGIKNIYVELTNVQTGELFTSNIVQPEMLEYTFDSEYITFDNTIITFDNEQL